MKAVVFEQHGGTEVLQYRDDVPVPEIAPNEALIRMRASAMNYNNIWARRGLPGMDFTFPHISGSDGAGIVEAVGDLVTNVKVGDEVIIHGAFSCGDCYQCIAGNCLFCPSFEIWGFQTGPNHGAEAEFSKAPARNLIPKPKSIDWTSAASFGLVLATAWRMLVSRATIHPGDTVMIWGGAGGLGCMAIQICKVFGAKSIAIVGNDSKAAFAENLGADYVINRNQERITRAVMKITKRRGVDVVFEHPGVSTWETSAHNLRWGGTIVTCGATTGFNAPLDIRFLWNKQQNYLGSHYGTTAELSDAFRFVESGQIKPVVTEVLPLHEIARGHQLIESGEIMGKIALVPG